MRTLASMIAISALTFSALQLVDQQYWPAAFLAVVGGVAYLARVFFPVPGRD
jgi:hypothetical protein